MRKERERERARERVFKRMSYFSRLLTNVRHAAAAFLCLY